MSQHDLGGPAAFLVRNVVGNIDALLVGDHARYHVTSVWTSVLRG